MRKQKNEKLIFALKRSRINHDSSKTLFLYKIKRNKK